GPFGKVVAVEGERPSALQYTGEHWDGDVGLLYLRARWYDPAIGRFLSEDPFPGFAALPQTQHAYVYVGNNPINLTDPSGQNPLLIGALGGAAIGGAIGAVVGWTGYVRANPGGRPEDYLASHDFWRAGRVGLASGAVAGAVTGALGPLLLPAAGTFLGSIIVSAELGGLGGALGRITSNLLTPCTPWYDGVPETVAVSIVIGGVLGGAGYGIRQGMAARAGAATVRPAGFIEYGPLDDLGRPTGAQGVITREFLETNPGTSANQSIRPPGFGGGAAGHARGHLIAKMLGGSGKIPENLVTLIQNPVNSPVMRGFEFQVYNAVARGETVFYQVAPIYAGTSGMPIGVTLSAEGSGGFQLLVTILNR
ncbi:MAG: hypothetical protein GY832_45120, partial [Chloroflexi bacterium]|nr:hypothetical protein [Chloroflexota bacterium]